MKRRLLLSADSTLRTFLRLSPLDAGEPFEDPHMDDKGTVCNQSARHRRLNVTDPKQPAMSAVALSFLQGPVSTILMPSFYTLVCLLSVPVNISALLAFSRRIRPKKPATIYMLNLASADLLFALLLPFMISYHFSGNNWIFGEVLCRVVTAAFYWNMYCSVLLITCISADRLLAVAYPIDSLAWRRPRNATIACVTMWMLSLAGSVPLVLSEQTLHVSELNITTCHNVQTSQLIWNSKLTFLILSCGLFFLPLLITVVCYGKVIWTLSMVPCGVPGRSRRRTRAMVMALTVLVIFVLCFMPTNSLLFAHYLQFHEGIHTTQEAPDGSYAMYLVFLCVGSLNCLLDPLVYYFGSSQCQKQLSSALTCMNSREPSNSHSSNSHSSSRFNSRANMKSSRTGSSKMTTSDTSQKNLNSQYKKLLI